MHGVCVECWGSIIRYTPPPSVKIESTGYTVCTTGGLRFVAAVLSVNHSSCTDNIFHPDVLM